MKKNYLMSVMLLLSLFTTSIVRAQERTITGKVTSIDDGTPVPGANVVLKGSTNGTTTDVDGNYKLGLPASGGMLVFSFIGFKSQEVLVGERSVIDVQLQNDVTELTEVVVTGYGEGQEKRSITGSVVSVKGESFKDLPVQSFDKALQGRAAGVQIGATSGQPGGALSIRIRGIGSFSASNQPLIIIDGVQVASLGQSGQASSNPLNSINPNDIADIQILKDAAAAAIYGAQSANGVIIVTTKTGNRGKAEKTQIDISAQEGIVQPQNLYKVLNGQQFAELAAQAEINEGKDPARAGGAYETYGNPNNPSSVTNYDWVKALFKDGHMRMYDVSVRGGDAKTSFLFSGSYNKQDGQVIKSTWERFTGRLNLTTHATEKLTINAKMSLAYNRSFGTIADGNFVNGPWVAAFASVPTVNAVNPENGEYVTYPFGSLANYNILQGVNQEVRLGRTLQTVSSASASYKIIPGLTLSGLVGVDFSMNWDSNQRPSTIAAFASYGGSSVVTNRRTLDLNSNVTLDYNKRIGDDHLIKVLVGYEYKSEQREGVSTTGRTFSNPYFTQLIGQASTPFAITSFWNQYKRLGIFAKVDYDLKDKYLVSGTIRRDGSSRFGNVHPYGNFYAGSLGWRLSSEPFLKDVSFISDLKIKAGYGVLGNSEIGDFATITKFGAAGGQYLGNSGLSISQLGNTAITWEKEGLTNIGVDFSLFNNRLFGTVEAWQKDNSDLLLSVPFLQSSGVRTTTIVQNAGKIQNKGIDVELGGIIVDKGGFNWTSRFNIAFLKNTVKSLYNGLDTLYSGVTPQYIVGQPLNFIYDLRYAGVNPANGMAMVYDRNGNPTYTPTAADATIVGSLIPKSYGGWTNTFSYKGITLDVLFQYQFGNKAENYDLYNLLSFEGGVNNQSTQVLSAWKNPGDVTNVPKVNTTGIINGIDQLYFGTDYGTSRMVSDASYIRLKSISLSYNFPTSMLSKAGFRSLRVFAQAYNLVTWTKYDGMDPEVATSSLSNGGSGTAYGNYPLGRQLSVGLNIGL